MESSQRTLSLSSRGLNSSLGWKAEEVQLAVCLQTFTPSRALPSCPDCYLHATRMAHCKVSVWRGRVSTGSKCVDRESQYCGLVPGAQWGSPTPSFTPRVPLDRLTPDGEGPCREELSHA